MKMANEKKSIIEEALLEAEKIDATFKSNAKEILSQTMSSEIEAMVKESLTGSKRRLKEEDEEEEEVTMDTEEGEEDMDLDLETETEDEGEGDLDLDLDIEGDDEGEEEMDLGGEDMDLDLGDESEEGEMDLDLDAEGDEMDLDLGDESEEGEMDVVDLSGPEVTDAQRISVFKKMGPDDEIEVVNDNGLVTLKDNKSGSEYRIELNSAGGVSNVEAEEIDLGENFKNYKGVIYEVVIDDEDEMSYMGSDYAEDEMSYMSKTDYIGAAQCEHEGELEALCQNDPKHPACKKDHMSYMKDKKSKLYGNQTKLDKNKNGRLDKEDFEMLRGEKDEEDEMSYMARTKSTKGRYVTGNRTNPYARARMGSSDYMEESKTPQITKLIKENTDLNTKNSTLETENTELKENQEKMVDALKQFRKKLQEVAVFNSNLTYAVRLFTENSTTKEEKQDILKRLDEAKDLKESQSIYKQLVKEYTNGKTPIKESIDEKINKTASSGAQISESSVFVHPELQNMKKLWEYSYKK